MREEDRIRTEELLGEEIIDILEENEFYVTYCGSDEKGNTYLEVEFYSNAGEDFIFSINGQTKKEILEDFRNYAQEFDPKEHAITHILNRGHIGTPKRIHVLIDDADDIKRTLEEVADKCIATCEKVEQAAIDEQLVQLNRRR